ncbi:hypothetical protein AJ78_05052 [Emergomyces pasteurianus Ep9510]|uniref:Uncharacterized protein n=1 Tax=Emergomyces pasteurianus Ep9510 TaxID=1447872 RepID=A0A1J9PF33_9EURO|nr:hypothetical protein AJ78_05052 [Emergomyces pasteurianus Ep9510]
MRVRRPTASVVRMMTTIPLELVHQILEDLTICNILLLTSHNNPVLDERIFSYLIYKTLLETQGEFSTLKTYFEVYCDIHTSIGLPKCPSTSPLATSISTREPRLEYLMRYMRSEIFNLLKVSATSLSVLEPFTNRKLNNVTPFGSISDTQCYWHTLRDVHGQLNGIKARQVRRIADIFETYPDLVYQTSDPRKVPVANVGHIVRRLRIDAEKTSRARVLRTRSYAVNLPSAWLFWPNLLPVMPLDKAMKLFVTGMQEYPPSLVELESASNLPQVDNELEDRMRLLSLNSKMDDEVELPTRTRIYPSASSSNAARPNHRYPKSNLQDIYTTIKGLAYVYMPPAVRDISATVNLPRTRDTPSSSPSAARFPGGFSLLDSYQDILDTSTISRLKGARGIPHDERELEWLEALLRCCRYLEQLGVEV